MAWWCIVRRIVKWKAEDAGKGDGRLMGEVV